MENTSKERSFGLNGSQLKIFAMAVMLVDHIGAFLLQGHPLYMTCRIIGRFAFPIFCMLIAEGAVHTRSITKYLGRLLLFAVVSTPPYNLVHGEEWYSLRELNVFFTLFFGLLGIASIKELAPRFFKRIGKKELAENHLTCVLFGVPFCLIVYLAAYALDTDYGGYGVAAVLIFYLLRKRPALAWCGFALITVLSNGCWFVGSSDYFSLNGYDLLKYAPWNGGYVFRFIVATQFYAILAAIPAAFYNGKKGGGGRIVKYAFYTFYPLHLLGIWIVQLIVG